jgi:serine/threonine protein kinase/tetratricopeptide (TPR) repeat protein
VGSSDRKPPQSSRDALGTTVLAPSEHVPGQGASRDSFSDTEPAPATWHEEPGAVPAAAQLGRFRVLRELGRGGMGLTYLAYDEELDRKVAVKLVHPDVPSNAAGQARLKREAQALARLAHPNIVHMYEVGSQQGQLFIAIEFIQGQTMAEWLEETPRSWREVVAMFRQAGEGLRAAHAAGLVHRDFKPSNVMIGDDGRVRVLDFGVAYLEQALSGEGQPAIDTATGLSGAVAGTAASAAAGTAASIMDSASAARRVDDFAGIDTAGATFDLTGTPPVFTGSRGRELALTTTGALIGTPAYMSPEQLACRGADARSDQFSFCVSLYEALFGDRPYIGATLADIRDSQERGAITEGPHASQVPGWLRAVVVRGLAGDPAARWPSMDALLAALARDPAHRRRSWLMAAALTAGAVGVAAMAWSWAASRSQLVVTVCSGARSELAGVWDDARKAEVATAMQATGISYAADTWTRTEGVLDRYADAWVTAYTDACEDTVVRREQPEEIRALRVQCLEERRQALRSFTDLLARADATAVEKATSAAGGLPRIESCADLAYLSARIKPPEDPAVAAEVARLREELTAAGELRRLGQFAPGLVKAREARDAAARLAYPPIQAEVLLRLGELQTDNGEYAEAETSLREAFFLARAADHHEVTYRAAIQLVFAVGTGLARHDDAHEWGRHAQAELLRGAPPEEQARLLSALGNVYYGEGKFAEATEHYRRSVALREQALGPEHPDVARVLNNLGIALRDQNQYREAAAQLERAVAILEKALGPEHPDVGGALGNLGIMFAEQGQYEQAAIHYRRALAILEKALGSEHLGLTYALGNLGIVLGVMGQYEEAAAYHRRALAIREQALGAEHPVVADSLDPLGSLLVKQGRLEEALPLHRRALRIREQGLGPEHPLVAETLTNLGITLHAHGKLDEAIAHHRRAVAILDKALGPDHEAVAAPLVELAAAHLERNRPAEALAAAERALALRSGTEGVAPVELAETQFVLARALVAAGKAGSKDRERAIELARQSRDTFQTLPRAAVAQALDAVDAWLRRYERP